MLPKSIPGVDKTLVMIDYANLRSSARFLGKSTNLRILYEYLKALSYVENISIYYGTDPENPKSAGFISWLRKEGFIVVTKDVKYIKVKLSELLKSKNNQAMLEAMEGKFAKQILNKAEELESKGHFIRSPKCNMDVEMAIDMYKSFDKYDGYILFTGDGDFSYAAQLARSEGKKIITVSLRKYLAGELFKSSDIFVNLDGFLKLEGFLYDQETQGE
ncbi:NYN domain-containing protein [bacterium]|nr:NYN domain-containing protein [bacterium]